MSTPRLPRMMLAFVVRRCTIELGHPPTPAEFAAWANGGDLGARRLFGRSITEHEAQIILRHQARLVSARSARAEERWQDAELEDTPVAGTNVISLAEARSRRAPRGR